MSNIRIEECDGRSRPFFAVIKDERLIARYNYKFLNKQSESKAKEKADKLAKQLEQETIA